MTRFTVDLDELDAVARSLESYGQILAGKLADLRQAVADLHGDWQGEAADAQKVAHDRLATGAHDLHRALLEVQGAARHAHLSYVAAVRANQQTWRQVH